MSREVAEMESLSEAWDKFKDEVIPPGCSRAQLVESKNAFYAGAAASMVMLLHKIENQAGPEKVGALMDHFLKEVTDQFDLDTQFKEAQFKA